MLYVPTLPGESLRITQRLTVSGGESAVNKAVRMRGPLSIAVLLLDASNTRSPIAVARKGKLFVCGADVPVVTQRRVFKQLLGQEKTVAGTCNFQTGACRGQSVLSNHGYQWKTIAPKLLLIAFLPFSTSVWKSPSALYILSSL